MKNFFKNKTYSAAIVGFGNIAYFLDKYHPPMISTHYSAYLKNSKIRSVSVCDINDKKVFRENLPQKINIYHDLDQMMTKEKPEIVSICSPDSTHIKVLRKILRYSSVKGIWCEKPIATKRSDALEMVSLCKKKKVKLVVNYIRQYDPFYQFLRKNMNRIVGEIQEVICLYSGGLATSGSHMLDLLQSFFGMPEQVYSVKEKRGSYFSNLRYKQFIVRLIPFECKKISIFELNIFGSKARMDILNKPFGDYEYRYFPLKSNESLGINYYSAKSRNIIAKKFKRIFFENALKDIINSIEKNRLPVSSGSNSLKSLELMGAIFYSTKIGKEIKIPFNSFNYQIPKPGGDVKKWKNLR